MRNLPAWAKTLLINLFFVAAGGFLLFYSTELTGRQQILANSVAIIFITSGFFAWWGAYLARLQVASTLIKEFGDIEAQKKTGFDAEVTWPIDIPSNAKNVDILVMRAHEWFPTQTYRLQDVLRNSGHLVRICLLHPESPTISALAAKFDTTELDVKSKIVESMTAVIRVTEEERHRLDGSDEETVSGKLILKGHKLIQNHTYYRFDDIRYIAWYAFRRGRQRVPLLRLKSGTLSDFFKTDFQILWDEKDTALIYDSENPRESKIALLQTMGIPENAINDLIK